MIKNKALNHVLLQHLSSPLPELHTSMRVNTIAHADNHVEVIEINLMGLSFAFNSTMLSGSCIFCNYLFGGKFS